jgi:arylsulfatase A-like enzyme
MTRPNIIFIVADDLGYADLGCYGGRPGSFGAVSPVLDGMAQSGLLFTEAYANSPVCSPTRFAMATGRYQYRLRGAAEEPINTASKASTTLGLSPEHPTLASLLQASGYRTALVGKWHLGYPPAFGPLRSGYQEFFGIMAGGVDYFTHCSSRGDHDLFEGEQPVHMQGYLTDLLSQRAVRFIEQVANATKERTPPEPFFLSLHYTAPHWPWETRADAALAPSLAGKLFHLQGGNVDTYRQMIHHMDEGIGTLMQALQTSGLAHNTLVVFTSDNGGERFSDNWPLVGGKMDLTEGGIRVPCIVHWPHLLQGLPAAARSTRQHCLTMDWTATLLHAAGAVPHPAYPLDGVSLLPMLQALPQQATQHTMPHTMPRSMHWRMNHRGQRALRDGDYKYLRVDGHDYLFNITQDARERANLGPQEPARLLAMRTAWEAWNQTMPPIPDDATVSLGFSARDMPQR